MDIKPLVKKIEDTTLQLYNAPNTDKAAKLALRDKVTDACKNLRGILPKDEADHQIGLAINRANKKFKKANK